MSELSDPRNPVSVSVECRSQTIRVATKPTYHFDPMTGVPDAIFVPDASQTMDVVEIETGFEIKGLPVPGVADQSVFKKRIRVTVEFIEP